MSYAASERNSHTQEDAESPSSLNDSIPRYSADDISIINDIAPSYSPSYLPSYSPSYSPLDVHPDSSFLFQESNSRFD